MPDWNGQFHRIRTLMIRMNNWYTNEQKQPSVTNIYQQNLQHKHRSEPYHSKQICFNFPIEFTVTPAAALVRLSLSSAVEAWAAFGQEARSLLRPRRLRRRLLRVCRTPDEVVTRDLRVGSRTLLVGALLLFFRGLRLVHRPPHEVPRNIAAHGGGGRRIDGHRRQLVGFVGGEATEHTRRWRRRRRG